MRMFLLIFTPLLVIGCFFLNGHLGMYDNLDELDWKQYLLAGEIAILGLVYGATCYFIGRKKDEK